MSRIGKSPVAIPSGVSVKFVDSFLEVTGPKGKLARNLYNQVNVNIEKELVTVSESIDFNLNTSYLGLYRTLISNMIHGVSNGYSKVLEIHGTGYRATMQGKQLTLTLGFSHPVVVEPPAGIDFEVDKSGKVIVKGCDKEVVGQIAAEIRSKRPPEPYQGKGVRYLNEKMKLKVGKSAGKK